MRSLEVGGWKVDRDVRDHPIIGVAVQVGVVSRGRWIKILVVPIRTEADFGRGSLWQRRDGIHQ